MHPAVEALTAQEAANLLDDIIRLNDFVDNKGVKPAELRRQLVERAGDCQPALPVIKVRPQRPDTLELIEMAEKAGRLPFRLRQVVAFCLVDGLSLDECAARMGVKRETVRVHLRRLRAMHRRQLASIARLDAIEASWRACYPARPPKALSSG